MARRTRGGRREQYHPKPVQKIELSEKHTGLRLALVVFLILVGLAAIGYAVSTLLGADPGWQEIEASTVGANCSADFTFLYYLDGGASASAEKKAVSSVYSAAAEKGYQLFHADQEFEGVCNVAYLNRHPNEEVEVDEALYRAFSQIQEAGDRSLYLAPVYGHYDDLFACSDDSQTVDYDPYINEELAREYAQAAAWANDPAAVDLELLEGGKVRLKVSEGYQSWAEENKVDRYLDFIWMKNAFLADYLAESLAEAGFTHGCLSSYDGFIRNLDGSGTSYSLPIYDRVGGTVYPAAMLDYAGPASLVYLRDYGMNSQDRQHYYQYATGEIRTPYLDARDGLCKSARGDLVCYSKDQSCAEVLLQMIPVYIADSFQAEKLDALRERQVFSVYCEDRQVRYNDPEARFTSLYQDEDIRYRTAPLQ